MCHYVNCGLRGSYVLRHNVNTFIRWYMCTHGCNFFVPTYTVWKDIFPFTHTKTTCSYRSLFVVSVRTLKLFSTYNYTQYQFNFNFWKFLKEILPHFIFNFNENILRTFVNWKLLNFNTYQPNQSYPFYFYTFSH